MTNIYGYISDLEELHIAKSNELDATKEMLTKATQMLTYVLWKQDDTWKRFPEHQIRTLLKELPPLPDTDEA